MVSKTLDALDSHEGLAGVGVVDHSLVETAYANFAVHKPSASVVENLEHMAILQVLDCLFSFHRPISNLKITSKQVMHYLPRNSEV